MRNDPDRAEFIQSVQAYYIPSSLFLATLITSAGMFLVYNGYALGYALLAIGISMVVAALTIFCRFQNKLRANGQLPRKDAEEASPPPASN